MKLLKPDLPQAKWVRNSRGRTPGRHAFFKSTGSDYPSLWEHFCFILQGKHHTHKAHNTPLSFSEFTSVSPAFTEKIKLARSPPQSQLCLSAALWARLTPPPVQIGCQAFSGHGEVMAQQVPLPLAHQFLPLSQWPCPPAINPCGHIIYLQTDTFSHYSYFILPYPWFPIYFALLYKPPSSTVYDPYPHFCKIIKSICFQTGWCGNACLPPDHAQSCPSKACSSLGFQENPSSGLLLLGSGVLPKSFWKHPSSSWPLSNCI